MRVLVAPDSFKGSATAVQVGAALRGGWLGRRPDDDVVVVPFSDGGEGLLEAVAAAVPAGWFRDAGPVTGPDGRRVPGRWLRLPDGTAVVELAQASGLPLMAVPDPLGATTRGTGEVVRAALADGATRVVLGLGGSASTDGGLGVLRGLGLRVVDDVGADVPEGTRGLLTASRVERTGLVPAPPGGCLVLTDVDNPLLGERGAAAVFGPQKGAGPDDVGVADAALRRWADLLGADPDAPGAGAAGGVTAGLAAVWDVQVVGGADWVADLVDLPRLVATADLVVTGEGRFDATSLDGKAVGRVLALAERTGTPAAVVAGSFGDAPPPGVRHVGLAGLAGSVAAAVADATRWLGAAGAALADSAEAAEDTGGAGR
ncbi:glycerate kinase [Aquipuribacter sp. SD81]|uniref:glycerate kinase n=1 Tax=Aquipuribacter sp. SD81 TaxID=3127703 RepID=UPI00301B1DA5